jgi:alpha,alpha-trehalase
MEIFESGQLFHDVQMQPIFADGKTFVDCVPNMDLHLINEKYAAEKNLPSFDLKKFVAEHFTLPVVFGETETTQSATDLLSHIDHLWQVLQRQPDEKKGSLIPLPYPYIVPGGRFGEVYYWDSYFTMLGLQAAGKIDLIENMINNFAHLIDEVGYIPNGNRTYYIGRSQPPFFSLMVQLLATEKGDDILIKYLPQLVTEHAFWMKGVEQLNASKTMINAVVKLQDGEALNRYWDDNETARPESYREDVELVHASKRDAKEMYRHLRAGAASGWDYSSRWFKDDHSFSSIHTTDIVPVDLNCLLLHLEQTIAKAFGLKSQMHIAEHYTQIANKRKENIQKYCWHTALQTFVDFDAKQNAQKNVLSLAMVFPLFFKIASQEQANAIAEIIKQKFVCAGGVVTSLQNTGQQWDAPNGWAPLQWMTIQGLQHYGFADLAATIAQRWLTLNEKVFAETGKMMEKYNVMDTTLLAGGGEYPGQDGFGWSNGVYLALKKMQL